MPELCPAPRAARLLAGPSLEAPLASSTHSAQRLLAQQYTQPPARSSVSTAPIWRAGHITAYKTDSYVTLDAENCIQGNTVQILMQKWSSWRYFSSFEELHKESRWSAINEFAVFLEVLCRMHFLKEVASCVCIFYSAVPRCLWC